MKINIKELKFRIKIIEDKKWKAIVTIDFGEFNIKGFRIRISEFLGKHGEHLWVLPPSYNSGGRFRPIVHFQKDIWEEIEKEITKAYKKKFNEYTKEKMG